MGIYQPRRLPLYELPSSRAIAIIVGAAIVAAIVLAASLAI